MLTFLVCLTALVIAYFTYGRYLERVAAIDPAHSVPSETLFDGVDYVPMPRWRVFLIQLLNIAGTGPIFGAILGAAFGPVAFLWITLGGIFMGAMHDFLSGVMLVRNDGLSIPEAAGRYLGTGMRQFMRPSRSCCSYSSVRSSCSVPPTSSAAWCLRCRTRCGSG